MRRERGEEGGGDGGGRGGTRQGQVMMERPARHGWSRGRAARPPAGAQIRPTRPANRQSASFVTRTLLDTFPSPRATSPSPAPRPQPPPPSLHFLAPGPAFSAPPRALQSPLRHLRLLRHFLPPSQHHHRLQMEHPQALLHRLGQHPHVSPPPAASRPESHRPCPSSAARDSGQGRWPLRMPPPAPQCALSAPKAPPPCSLQAPLASGMCAYDVIT